MTNTKLPAPAWPWWLSFAAFVPLAAVVVLLVVAGNAAAVRRPHDEALVGRNAVITAPRTSESTASVPWQNATYELTFPESAPGALAGSTHEFVTPYHQLFTGKTFPNPGEFHVIYSGDGGYTVAGPEPVGTFHVITASEVAENAPPARRAVDIDALAVAVYLALATALLVVAIVRTNRRNQAEWRNGRRQWTPDPSWPPPASRP